MAINIDHTNSANITLRGPAQASSTDVINFVFPNTMQGQANLLVSGDASIASIAGLTDALDAKVSASTTGSAASLNAGTAPGEIPVLNADGKLEESVIPSVAIKDVFTVSTKSDLFGYSSARIGDVGLATSEGKNYILTSNDYTSDADWKEIVFPNQLVTSVNGLLGSVNLTACEINYGGAGDTVHSMLACLYDNKLESSCLSNFATQSDLSTSLSSYATYTDLSNCTSSFVNCSDFSNCISQYYTSSTIDSCLLNYVLTCNLGSAACCNVGTNPGDVVQVNQDGKIDNSLVPSLAITDVFVISSCSDLAGIVGAEEGDVAVATTELKSYILDGSSNWQPLGNTVGGVSQVNSISPVNGSITLDSDDIMTQGTSAYNGTCLSSTLQDMEDQIDNIQGDYLTTQEATDLLACYETICNVTSALSNKADVGHTHAISDVTDLSTCLSDLSVSAFIAGAGNYSATQYGENNGMNEACGAYSIAMGYGAVAKQDYEIAHAAGWFNNNGNPGDAQSSKIVAKSTTNSCDFTEVSYLLTDSASVLFFKVDMVGLGSTSAAFRLEGATNSSALLNNVSVTTFADSNETIAVSAVHCGSCVSFQASGENGMKWVSSIQSVKLK
jgi:hypothetical protein